MIRLSTGRADESEQDVLEESEEIVVAKVRKLYILRIDEDTFKYINSQLYRLIMPTFALVLAKKKPDVPCAELTQEDVNKLPKKCRQWLVKCIVEMAEAETRSDPQKVLDAQYEFLQEFERELESERLKWEESHGKESPEGESD